MKTLVICGAGQMGQAALRLIDPCLCSVAAFADNNPGLQGGIVCGIPVLSIAEAVYLNPDSVLVAVVGDRRTEELYAQLRTLGYGGTVRSLRDHAEILDVRGAVLSLLVTRLRDIPGDLAELGVYQGAFASRINRMFPERTLYLFDTFQGFDSRDLEMERGYSGAAAGDFSDTSLSVVLSKMVIPDRVIPRKGYFPETAEGLETRFALVSLDVDLYEPTLQGLRYFYPRLSSGGVILLHDYHNARFAGVRAAVEQYEREKGRILLLPVGDLHGSVMIVRP